MRGSRPAGRFLGSTLAVINPTMGIAGYWAQSYWGSALAATGGALVLGGVRRLIRQARIRDSLLTGIGLAILAVKKYSSASWHIQRGQLLEQLKREGGKHLVVVSYGPGHSVHSEWVYNEADIDGAKVVFARAISNTQDCQLTPYSRLI